MRYTSVDYVGLKNSAADGLYAAVDFRYHTAGDNTLRLERRYFGNLNVVNLSGIIVFIH